MRSFRIFSKLVDLGTYRGDTKEDALDAYARDAGYADYATACEITDDEVMAVEIEC